MCFPAGARVGSATRLLAEQQERALGQRARDVRRGREHLVLVPADVHRAGARHVLVLPRDRPVERPVELDRRGPEPVAPQPRRVAPAQRVAAQREERRRQHVGHDDRGRDALAALDLDARHAAALDGDPRRARAGADAAAERGQVADERVGEPPRAALRARPADRVAEQVEVRRRDRAARAVRRDVAVHRRAVEPRARAARPEQLGRERGGGREQQARELERPAQAQGGEQPRRSRDGREPGEHRRPQRAEVAQVGRGERAPALPVAGRERVQARGGRVDVPEQDGGAPVRQRMRRAGPRVHPAQAVALERPAREHRRGDRRGVDRREHVVTEARERELLGGHRAAGARRGLEHEHVAPGLGQRDRGRQPVRPRADDDRRPGHAAPSRLTI